ncbi:MAG: septation protein A [Pseudomonadota bacterium]
MREINPIVKFLLEIGPLAVFFLTFNQGEKILAVPEMFAPLASVTGAEALEGKNGPLFVATASFMVAISISLAVSWVLARTLPKMAVVTLVVVMVFGGLTLWLGDDTFIKMKPTIVNGIFAAILFIGLMQGRSYLKYLMGDSLPMTDEGWMIFTKRWCAFFVFLGLLNELIWRTQTTEFWVSFKTFGNLPITLAFMALQYPLLKRHSAEE